MAKISRTNAYNSKVLGKTNPPKIGVAEIEIEGADLTKIHEKTIQIKIGDTIYSGIANNITCENHSQPIVQGTVISMGYVSKSVVKVDLDYRKPAFKKGQN